MLWAYGLFLWYKDALFKVEVRLERRILRWLLEHMWVLKGILYAKRDGY